MILKLLSREKIIDVGQSLAGMVVAAAFQVISFLLLAHTLGVRSFGFFVSAVAIGLTISELVGLGTGENLVRVAARDKQMISGAFRYGLKAIIITSIMIGLPLVPLAAWFLAPEGMFFPIIALIASEAVITRTALYCEHSYLGLQDYRLTAIARILVPAFRCLGFILIILTLDITDMTSLICMQIGATILATVIMLSHLFKLIGKNNGPNPGAIEKRNWFNFGAPVAIANLQRSMQLHADKYLVTLFAGPEIGGIYAAGFRLIQMALLPLQAYIRTTYGGFFSAGRNGLQASVDYAKTVVTPLLLIAIFCTIVAYMGSFLVVFLLGEDYAPASFVVRVLSPLLILWALQYVMTDILMGADRVWPRIWISLTANIVGFTLLVILAGSYGINGVVTAVLATMTFFISLLFITIRVLLTRPIHQ